MKSIMLDGAITLDSCLVYCLFMVADRVLRPGVEDEAGLRLRLETQDLRLETQDSGYLNQ